MAEIVATRYADTLTGTADPDRITGSRGPDLVFGGQGGDTITSGGVDLAIAGRDTLRGGGGDDVIQTQSVGGQIYGDNGNDTLTHTASDDSVLLEGGPGDDRIDGAHDMTGMSMAAYLTAASGVQVSLAETGPQTVGGGMGADTLVRLNGLVGSPYADTLSGGANGTMFSQGVLLWGGAGDDVLVTDARGGTLSGGEGDDRLVGGGAYDWADYGPAFPLSLIGAPAGGAAGGVQVSLALGTPQAVGGGAGVDTLVGIENLIGSDFGDTLSGDAGGNTLLGGAGDDRLEGLDGADNLYGGTGADTALGGAGADTVNGGDGDDLLQAGDGDDDLGGGEGNDALDAGAGNDEAYGGNGDDRLTGGDGDDFLYAGPGSDVLQGSAGRDQLQGEDGADTLRGGQGDDSVAGGSGNDWLSGDRGGDTLTGGAGADTFHSFADAGLDRVTDFNGADGDRVQLLAGSSWTTAQSGDDVVISLSGGAQMVLVGVQLSTLPNGWIFTA